MAKTKLRGLFGQNPSPEQIAGVLNELFRVDVDGDVVLSLNRDTSRNDVLEYDSDLNEFRFRMNGVTVPADQALLAKMDAIAGVTAATGTTPVGFQLVNRAGNPVARAALVQLVVTDDADLITPATNASFDTETAGSIKAGRGTASVIVKTSAAGKFSCALLDSVVETVHVACTQTAGSPALDCADIASGTFS